MKHGLDLQGTKIDLMYLCSWMPEEAASHAQAISQMAVSYFSSIKKDLCELTCALSSKTK